MQAQAQPALYDRPGGIYNIASRHLASSTWSPKWSAKQAVARNTTAGAPWAIPIGI